MAPGAVAPSGARRLREIAGRRRILEIPLAARALVRRDRLAATIREDDAVGQTEDPLLVLALVLGPRIERIADLQHAGETA